MLKEFLDFVNDNQLFTKHDSLLVAVSGGIDSIVLVDLLSKNGFNFEIAHCNFSLRGTESDGDENFIKDLAKNLNINCLVKQFYTNKYATENRISTQMAARELRYEWFKDLIIKNNYKGLITAHHLDDSIETAIFNFTKGTGVAGLRGILSNNNGILRPLLFASKETIEKYALNNNLSWREDSSNASIKYNRNYIRKEVIPLLKRINPGLEETFKITSKRMASLEELLKEKSTEFHSKFRFKGDDISVKKEDILSQKWVVIEDLLKNYGFNYDQVDNILKCLSDGISGKLFNSSSHVINIDRDQIIISLLTANNQLEWMIDEHGEIKINSTIFKFQITNDKTYSLIENMASLDFEKLKFPLKIRHWKEGDTFQPLGMKGKKKLSDFMIDEKIPLNLKRSVLVLVSNEEIVWVAGHRIDDRYKITNKTKKVFNIDMKND
jgi:tRNA(Ile)-lysidine synthase